MMEMTFITSCLIAKLRQKFRVDDFPVASDLINKAMKALLHAIRNHRELRL